MGLSPFLLSATLMLGFFLAEQKTKGTTYDAFAVASLVWWMAVFYLFATVMGVAIYQELI